MFCTPSPDIFFHFLANYSTTLVQLACGPDNAVFIVRFSYTELKIFKFHNLPQAAGYYE
jgi:hypothetical protein